MKNDEIDVKDDDGGEEDKEASDKISSDKISSVSMTDSDFEKKFLMKKKKLEECCRKVKKKNLKYHFLSKHKIITNGSKPEIKALIKKKMTTINNMFIDIEAIKKYKGFVNYAGDKELNDYFIKLNDLKQKFKNIRSFPEKRTNKKTNEKTAEKSDEKIEFGKLLESPELETKIIEILKKINKQ